MLKIGNVTTIDDMLFMQAHADCRPSPEEAMGRLGAFIRAHAQTWEAFASLEAQGCANPACQHTDHGNGFYLQQQCHKDGSLSTGYARPGVVCLVCDVCTAGVASLLVEPHTPAWTWFEQSLARLEEQTPLVVGYAVLPACHPKASFEARIHRGQVALKCSRCRKTQQTFPVASRAGHLN
jgi:hypothetical protein